MKNLLIEGLDYLETLVALGIDADTIVWPTPAITGEAPDAIARDEPARLTEDEWAMIAAHLPRDPPQAEAMANREFLEAVLWTLAQRKTWTQLSAARGEAVRKRFARWAHAGVWQQLSGAVQGGRLGAARQSQLAALAKRAERLRQGVQSRRAAE